MDAVESYLSNALNSRAEQKMLRKLKVLPADTIDFSSNDFLGFAHSRLVDKQVQHTFQTIKEPLSGSGGSRLISGNSAYAGQLEADLARFYQAEATLLFNSGYDANLGLLSCIAGRHDTILYDELCHASIIDGIRLSQAAKKYKFKHNDTADLQKKLKLATGNIFVVAETVYSMDGDTCQLRELVKVAADAGAALILDEAHATGAFGTNGAGFAIDQQLHHHIFARVHTFGKALGSHGAVVAGSLTLKNYLVNFARSFIYTTALPLHSLLTIDAAHQLLPAATEERAQLWTLIRYFDTKAKLSSSGYTFLKGESPIQSVITANREKALHLAQQLQAARLDIRAILSPTVAEGAERLRICLHSFNTKEEIDHLFDILEHA